MQKSLHKMVAALGMSAAVLLLLGSAHAQTTPAVGIHENTPNVIALTNAKIVVAPGQVLENATLVVRDGYIAAVGANAAIPADAVSTDMAGKTIYPGFIDLFSSYGMPKERQQRTARQNATPFGGGQSGGSAPSDESGPAHWNPAVLAEKSAAELFTPDDKTAESLRKQGFTAVLTFQDKGIFRGNGALAFLGKGEPNELIYADDMPWACRSTKIFAAAPAARATTRTR